MSSTPADPYRGPMINYSPHDSSKNSNREDIISYGAHQFPQDRPTENRYHPDTIQPVYGSPSTFITNHSHPRQSGSHYNTTVYRNSPIQGSRKRQRTDNDPGPSGDTDHTYGYPPILQNIHIGDPSAPTGESTDLTYADHVGPSSSHQTSNQDYLQIALPQQHHHHRLPPQAFGAATSTDQGSEARQIDRSIMNRPGMPKPCPAPKAPKTRFGPVEDATLIDLKENWQLSWKDIGLWFPGRRQQTLQVRYCTKLKERNVVWDDDLDQKLKKALKDYEDNKWSQISRKVGPGIPAATCKLRAEEIG